MAGHLERVRQKASGLAPGYSDEQDHGLAAVGAWTPTVLRTDCDVFQGWGPVER